MGNTFANVPNPRYMKDEETQTARIAPQMVCSSTQTDGGPVMNEIDDHSNTTNSGYPGPIKGGAETVAPISEKDGKCERLLFTFAVVIVIFFTTFALYQTQRS
ncbi:uncharacterized protein [Clytia hemisphaerica]|uniref:uncharacterized protein isoform X2 n=1 Tax=Clytia hemisphaerica TaxID=252671 RepID=UPI0034D771E8